ncbi:MAG: monovalent cation/H+ antiporter subunit D family protein [Clostridiales bacterium]|nr:monovalent cation/H+ antiporter subunit D family protein [Clostridiales bacterium]
MNYLPMAAVLTPFAFALLMAVLGRDRSYVRNILALTGSFITFLITLVMLPLLRTDGWIYSSGKFLSSPITISFGADSLSVFFAVIFSFCYLMAIIYSFGYIAHSHAINRYYTLMLITLGAMMGIVLTPSLVGLFLFFEVYAVAAYLLVIHEEDEFAMAAGALFLYTAVAGGLFIFFGLATTYFMAGRVDFFHGGYMSANPLSAAALFAFLIGFGVKAGMFPVHIWLPEAHPAAPAPFSALLSGCGIKVGIYGLIRIIFDVYGTETVRAVSFDKVLLILAVVTILFGSALALQQDHLKRRLAYSSVAQIGYVLLGVALLNERALFGALFHIFSHALMKGTLFLCAGAIITQTGKKYVSELKGIGREMPVIMLSFTLAAITMVGIPPFNAFISKWHLALASLESGQAILVAVLMVSSLLNALYYFPIVIKAFLSDKGGVEVPLSFGGEISSGMLWTTALMALLCVGFAFIQPHWPVMMASDIASSFFK